MADSAFPTPRPFDSRPAPLCPDCGSTVTTDSAAACPTCLDASLRSIDASFLDNYSRFGARSRQVVAEVCLRALVLSDIADRKILGATVYEQFVETAADLINLYYALLGRNERSIAHSFLSFRLDQTHCLNFFADVIELSPTDILDSLGLVHPDRLHELYPELLKREERELSRALHEAIRDLERLADYQEIGEAALARASEQMHGVFALTDRFPWPEDGELTADRVAALAFDAQRGRIALNSLAIDEARLAEVVDGIDVMTRLARNLIYAFLSINEPEVLRQDRG
jgi:hypothetical protein